MVDKGDFIHTMEHSENTQFDENGILYWNSYTKLRNDLGTEFQFGSSFFLQIYVNPSTPAEDQERLIFQKTGNGGKIILELWINTISPKGELIVKIDGTTKTYSDFFEYGTSVRIGVYIKTQRMEIFQNTKMLENFKALITDDSNQVFLLVFLINC